MPLFDESGAESDSEVARGARGFDEAIDCINAALQRAIDETRPKRSDFAADHGISTPQLSLELRAARDSKGAPQYADVRYLAWLYLQEQERNDGAFERVVSDLAAMIGRKLEAVEITDKDAAHILSGMVSPEAKRGVEQQRSLPRGTLDR